MGYKECKSNMINNIICKLDTLSIDALHEIERVINKNQPQHIRDFIDATWSEKSEGFRDDLEHEIRKFWLLTGPGCRENGYLIDIIDDSLECYVDISINGQEPDIWVMEKGTDFNPSDIAQLLFFIYTDKVVFK